MSEKEGGAAIDFMSRRIMFRRLFSLFLSFLLFLLLFDNNITHLFSLLPICLQLDYITLRFDRIVELERGHAFYHITMKLRRKATGEIYTGHFGEEIVTNEKGQIVLLKSIGDVDSYNNFMRAALA